MYQPVAENHGQEVYDDRMKPRVVKGQVKNGTYQDWMKEHPYQPPKRIHFSRMKAEENAYYLPQRRGSKTSQSSQSGKQTIPTRPQVNNRVWNDRFDKADLPAPAQIVVRHRPSSAVVMKNEPYVSVLSSPTRESSSSSSSSSPGRGPSKDPFSEKNIADNISEPAETGGIPFRAPRRSSEPVILSPSKAGGRGLSPSQSPIHPTHSSGESNNGGRIHQEQDHTAIKSYLDKTNTQTSPRTTTGTSSRTSTRATSPMPLPVDSFLAQRFGVKGWSGGIFRDNSPVPNTCRTSRDSTDGRSPLIWHVSRNGLGRASSPRTSMSPMQSYERKEGLNTSNDFIRNSLNESIRYSNESIRNSPRKNNTPSGPSTIKSKGVGVTRSTSPIDERIIRMVLGDGQTDSMDFEPDSRHQQNSPMKSPKGAKSSHNNDPIRILADYTTQLSHPLHPSQSTQALGVPENVMASMARVMEAVESIVRNGAKPDKNTKEDSKKSDKKSKKNGDNSGKRGGERSDDSRERDERRPREKARHSTIARSVSADPGTRSGESKNNESRERGGEGVKEGREGNREAIKIPYKGKKYQVVDLILAKIQAMEQREREIGMYLRDPARTSTSSPHTPHTPHHVTFEPKVRNQESTIPDRLRSIPASSYPDPRLLSAPSSSSSSSSSSGVHGVVSFSPYGHLQSAVAPTSSSPRYTPHTTTTSSNGTTTISGSRSGSGISGSGSSIGGGGYDQGQRYQDQWQAPKVLDINETAMRTFMSLGMAAKGNQGSIGSNWGPGGEGDEREDGVSAPGLVSFQAAKKRVKGGDQEDADEAAIERQQYALDQMPRLLPTVELRQEMKEYKRDLAIARELREAAFRARGVTLAETIERVGDAIAFQLSDEAAGEIDGFVDQYAERFIGQI